jgi:hypothetical protein
MSWLIDILTIPQCPVCEDDLPVDAIGNLPPAYVADSNGENLLTCGHCGSYQGESLDVIQAGEILF